SRILGIIPAEPPSMTHRGRVAHTSFALSVLYLQMQEQSTVVQIEPDSSMNLTGSSKEGQQVDTVVEFSFDTGPSDLIETQADDSMEPCLSYAMSGDYGREGFLFLTPENSLLLSQNALWDHLSTQLRALGVGPQIIKSFVDCHSENLQLFDYIVYRFISQEESAKMVKLSVGLADC
ncbi:522_t:CDS:2, partial [Acaulospora colombiana]